MILSSMKPPYQITETIFALVASISEKIGEINATHLYNNSNQALACTQNVCSLCAPILLFNNYIGYIVLI